MDESARQRELQAAFDLLFAQACHEDFGDLGDITSDAIFAGQTDTAVILARQEICLSGVHWAAEVFRRLDPALEVQAFSPDGTVVPAGATVMQIAGPVGALLRAERTALNFLGYLSGIATQTRHLVRLLAGLGPTVILDTRKTLPGYRVLAKEAVRHGGGTNHRMGLYDMVMIKDNHIDAAGGITPAVRAVRQRWGSRFPVEVECRDLADVREALGLAPEVIMLDNMGPDDCRTAVQLRQTDFPASTTRFEASGDMDQAKLQQFGSLGLDYISVGRLTHSVTNANFSLRMLKGKGR